MPKIDLIDCKTKKYVTADCSELDLKKAVQNGECYEIPLKRGGKISVVETPVAIGALCHQAGKKDQENALRKISNRPRKP